MSFISHQTLLNTRLEHIAPNETLRCVNAIGLKELEVSKAGLVIEPPHGTCKQIRFLSFFLLLMEKFS
jgi:hypothetical protein